MGKGQHYYLYTLIPALHMRTWKLGGLRGFTLASNGETGPAINAMRVLSAGLLLTKHEEYFKEPVRVSLEFAKMLVELSWFLYHCYHLEAFSIC